MSDELSRFKTKLEVKKQWFCDGCGEVIESDKDGMLEWDKYFKDDDEIVQENFRVVHGRWIKSCRRQHTDRNLADGHLHYYTGSDGLNRLLSMLQRPSLDQEALIEIIRRLHVDFYEEGGRLLEFAIQDGDTELTLDDRGDITQGDLVRLIKKYGNREV